MKNFQYRVCWLREQFPWMGSHSGYDMLCNSMDNMFNQRYSNIFRSNLYVPRILIKCFTLFFNEFKKSETYDCNSFITEIKSICRLLQRPSDITHVLYLERTLGLLPKLSSKFRGSLVGTVHQPAALWRIGRHETDIIKSLQALIVLSSKEIQFFEEVLPDRVHFIPHGIDTDFFRPISDEFFETKIINQPRCIFSGVWLRDIETLFLVVEKVLERNPNIKFDMLVPKERRNNPLFYRIAGHNQVFWHSNISDDQLRDLYQCATMLVLPLLDCTANNALLEAIACGLPVVTNNVGGVKDYIKEDFADLLPPGEVDGMADAILKHAMDPEASRKRGLLGRSFAEKHLSWRHVAEQTIALYDQVYSISQ